MNTEQFLVLVLGVVFAGLAALGVWYAIDYSKWVHEQNKPIQKECVVQGGIWLEGSSSGATCVWAKNVKPVQ